MEITYTASVRKPNGEFLSIYRRPLEEVLDWIIDNATSGDKFELLERRGQWSSVNYIVLTGNIDILQSLYGRLDKKSDRHGL